MYLIFSRRLEEELSQRCWACCSAMASLSASCGHSGVPGAGAGAPHMAQEASKLISLAASLLPKEGAGAGVDVDVGIGMGYG